jgi:hypothetical protein
MMPCCKIIPGSNVSHHVLYAMNRYNESFDVIDSLSWPTRSRSETTRSGFHKKDIKEIVSS